MQQALSWLGRTWLAFRAAARKFGWVCACCGFLADRSACWLLLPAFFPTFRCVLGSTCCWPGTPFQTPYSHLCLANTSQVLLPPSLPLKFATPFDHSPLTAAQVLDCCLPAAAVTRTPLTAACLSLCCSHARMNLTAACLPTAAHMCAARGRGQRGGSGRTPAPGFPAACTQHPERVWLPAAVDGGGATCSPGGPAVGLRTLPLAARASRRRTGCWPGAAGAQPS